MPQDATGRVEVQQGYLEGSNTQAVNELVSMIGNFRAYEATQRIIRQMDQSVQRLLRAVQ
jgi:flagellar basal-body rod protein FlgG